MRLFVIGMGMVMATAVFGDTITLKNGQVVNGTFLGGTAREIRIDLGDQVQTLQISDVSRIEFGGPPPQAPPPPEPQMAAAVAPAENQAVLGMTLPAGTNLIIRMIDAVDSQKAHTGQTFMASLDAAVNDPNGNVLIPRGADVVVKLVDSQQSGKITVTHGAGAGAYLNPH